jgi:hypothetical protein
LSAIFWESVAPPPDGCRLATEVCDVRMACS